MELNLCEIRTYTKQSYTHHHPHSQLILPLQGSLSIKSNDYELNLDDNHLFFLPPECHHSYHSSNINKILVLDISKGIGDFLLGNKCSSELYHVIDERWKAIRYLLYEESKRADKRSVDDLIKYACKFLWQETKPISIQYIHDNFEKSLSLNKLASMENFNESYYIEWFNKKTGRTPNEYIQNLRIEKVKEYLTNTDLSILMIAQLVGYKQQSSLTRLFKKHEALSPKDYRKMYRIMGKNSPI